MADENVDLRGKVVQADYVFVNDRFENRLQLRIDLNGCIANIGTDITVDGEELIVLKDRALLPGLVSAHSHAFHRGMRGRSHIGQKAKDSFWGWRQDMYEYVTTMTVDKFYQVCYQTFNEMRRAGITTVGEFHYFHHSQQRHNAKDTTDTYDLDRVILRAANDAHIRICLLLTYYEQAGLLPDNHLVPAQRHFLTLSQEEFWTNYASIEADLAGDTQTLGVAAHSIRAVSVANAKALCTEARRRGVPYHMHMEEQPTEIHDCQTSLHFTPCRIVLDTLQPDSHFTGVHCTYTNAHEFEALLATGANVCICPLTEGYLGDGIAPLHQLIHPEAAGAAISLGTDCNNRLCIAEEMRWLMYTQQMLTNRRGAACFPDGAASLLRCATQNGARSLALDTNIGQLRVGYKADFIALDLDAAPLHGCTIDQLVDAFVFGCSTGDVVRENCVNGVLRRY